MTAPIATRSAAGSGSPTVSTAAAGMTGGAVRTWLRLEGLAAFGAGIALFAATGDNWLLLAALLLVPDLSAAGYLAGPRVGAFTYNLVHTWASGLIVLGASVWLASPALQVVASVLITHVGMDRVAGYGLKLPGSFQETHLGRIGRANG